MTSRSVAYRVALNFYESLILRIGDFLCFAGVVRGSTIAFCIEKTHPPHSILMTSHPYSLLYRKDPPLEFYSLLYRKDPPPTFHSDDVTTCARDV